MKPETVAALYEMARAAAKQFANYDGPIVVTICGRGQKTVFRRLRYEEQQESCIASVPRQSAGRLAMLLDNLPERSEIHSHLPIANSPPLPDRSGETARTELAAAGRFPS